MDGLDRMRLPGRAFRYTSSGATHVGRVRRHNEDAFIDRPDLGLWAVADGMGGHTAGDRASAAIIDVLHDVDPPADASGFIADVMERLVDTNRMLRAEAAARGSGIMIASTVVILLAFDRHFACVWAGDSRLYLLREGRLRQVSRDHSHVQELVDGGLLPADRAHAHPQANVVTRAVGAFEELNVETCHERLLPDDRFLLCSDGLTRMLGETDLAAAMQDGPAGATVQSLIETALNRGATDNVTAVVVQVGEGSGG